MANLRYDQLAGYEPSTEITGVISYRTLQAEAEAAVESTSPSVPQPDAAAGHPVEES